MKLSNIQSGILQVTSACRNVLKAEFDFRINGFHRETNERMPEPAFQMWLAFDHKIDELLAMRDTYMVSIFSGNALESQMLNLQKIITDMCDALLIELNAIIAMANRLLRESKGYPKEDES